MSKATSFNVFEKNVSLVIYAEMYRGFECSVSSILWAQVFFFLKTLLLSEEAIRSVADSWTTDRPIYRRT